MREHRLGERVHHIAVRGDLRQADPVELRQLLEAALAGGVRWLILELGEALNADYWMLATIGATHRQLRARDGELIVTGASRAVCDRLRAFPAVERPALAASTDQATTVLTTLHPKTELRRALADTRHGLRRLSQSQIQAPAAA